MANVRKDRHRRVPGRHHAPYSTEQIFTILRILERNEFNLVKTSEETGVGHSTLHGWQNKYGEQVFKANRFNEILNRVDAQLDEERKELHKKSIMAYRIVIDRIIKLGPKEKNFQKLVLGLKELHSIVNPLKIDVSQPSGIQNQQNIFYFLNQMIKDNEKPKDRITGGGEEPAG